MGVRAHDPIMAPVTSGTVDHIVGAAGDLDTARAELMSAARHAEAAGNVAIHKIRQAVVLLDEATSELVASLGGGQAQ